MLGDEVLKMKSELDEANSHRAQLMRQVDELKKELISKEECMEKYAQTITAQHDRIKVLEGQVDAYQYCLNCRR